MPGRVALITGAARGLGKRFAHLLLSKETRVCLVDNNQKLGMQTASELGAKYGSENVIYIPCDITNDEEFAKAFEMAKSTFNKLDVVVNNAGIIHENDWKQTLCVNLTAVIHGCLLAHQHMGINNGGEGGVIVNVASSAGVSPMSFAPVYTATKHGVVGYSRAIASSSWYKKTGVRVNCLCPFFTDSSILKTTPEQVFDVAEAVSTVTQIGVVKPEMVNEAFKQVVYDRTLNGAVLLVTPTKGIQQVRMNAEL